ncbi:MAG: hypothetical protein GY796_11320, partial [Chloroflexi bacterium]|nr:hypothetical protein [Chloroflexota bacterium]
MVLGQLQLQMTRATFETWLKDTYVGEAQNGTWKIAVKNSFAKDWLENRLFNTVIRTLKNCSGQDDITLEFFVSENGTQPPDIPLTEVDPAACLPTDLACPDYSQFVPHIKDINRKTGYIALDKYYVTYCEPYLTRRWKSAGRRAWVLWEKLITLDNRKVTDE